MTLVAEFGLCLVLTIRPALGDDGPDTPTRGAAGSECDDVGRRRVQPLRVVNQNQHRARFGAPLQQRVPRQSTGQAHPATRAGRSTTQHDGVDRGVLWFGELLDVLLRYLTEQLGQSRVRNPAIGLRPQHAQDPFSALMRGRRRGRPSRPSCRCRSTRSELCFRRWRAEPRSTRPSPPGRQVGSAAAGSEGHRIAARLPLLRSCHRISGAVRPAHLKSRLTSHQWQRPLCDPVQSRGALGRRVRGQCSACPDGTGGGGARWICTNDLGLITEFLSVVTVSTGPDRPVTRTRQLNSDEVRTTGSPDTQVTVMVISVLADLKITAA